MYLSFLVLLAGDIQLNPGPDADCAPRVHAAGVGPGPGAEAGRGVAGWIGERAGTSAAELVRHLWRPADPEVVGGFPAGDSCGCSVRTTVRVPALEDPEAVEAPCARVDRASVGVAPADGPADCLSDLAQSRALLSADFSNVDEAEEAILDTDLKSLCVQGSRGAPNRKTNYTKSNVNTTHKVRTLEWHQDYLSSLKDSLVLRPCVQDRIALRYNALRLAASSSHLYGNDLQHIAAVDLFNLRSNLQTLSFSAPNTD
ncbi:unnamed protein product [Leuciscus chuanchicus]